MRIHLLVLISTLQLTFVVAELKINESHLILKQIPKFESKKSGWASYASGVTDDESFNFDTLAGIGLGKRSDNPINYLAVPLSANWKQKNHVRVRRFHFLSYGRLSRPFDQNNNAKQLDHLR
ncbi:hypothetical protein M3Y98_00101100 [Aphelenchoides besseyi]|nr:hypothetical protein M3Y98_00101100 [Aphelenchoides besseyi]KAI6194439.1 hypothetical protein M3Y96_01125000 [Aphelenchoides besseyi]